MTFERNAIGPYEPAPQNRLKRKSSFLNLENLAPAFKMWTRARAGGPRPVQCPPGKHDKLVSTAPQAFQLCRRVHSMEKREGRLYFAEQYYLDYFMYTMTVKERKTI